MASRAPALSVVIPCYNEAQNIPHVLERFKEAFTQGKLASVELILVDNNSKDGTQKVLKRLLPKYRFARGVFQQTPGYGAAITKGLREAKGEYLCWTHADLQTPPSDVVRAYRLLEKQKDRKRVYVKGERYGRPLFDQFFTSGMSVLETAYLGTILYDINAQPNLFHRSFFGKITWVPDDFSLDLFMLYAAKRRGLRVIRFPVQFGKRIYGTSAWNTGIMARVKFIRRTLAFTRKLDRSLQEQGMAPPKFLRKYWGLFHELIRVPLFGFLFFGGLSTILNYGLFYLLYAFAGVQYLLSAGIGYVSGVLFSFAFNKTVSFRSKGKAHHELVKYFGVYTTTLLLSIGMLALLVRGAGLDPRVANVLVILVSTVLNFLGCKHLVFR